MLQVWSISFHLSQTIFYFYFFLNWGTIKEISLLLVCILVHQIFVSVILFKLPKNQTLKKEKGCFLSSLPFIFLHIHLSCFSFPFLQLENFTIGGWKMKTHITRLIKRYKTFSKEMTHLYFEPFDSDQLFVQVFSEIFVLWIFLIVNKKIKNYFSCRYQLEMIGRRLSHKSQVLWNQIKPCLMDLFMWCSHNFYHIINNFKMLLLSYAHYVIKTISL